MKGAKSLSGKMLEETKKLKEELKTLRQRWTSEEATATRWADRRNALNKQIKDLRSEAASLRERRDSTNEKVKTLKQQRNQTRSVMQQNTERIKQLKEKLFLLHRKKPNKPPRTIKQEKDEIEWKIQTTSLTLQEEKPLVTKANQLKIQLDTHRQIIATKTQIAELQARMPPMNEKAEQFHTRLSELALQSQELHVKMNETRDKANSLHIEADKYHSKFVDYKEKSNQTRKEIGAIQRAMKNIQRKLDKVEEQEKLLQLKKTRSKMKADAIEKLRRGRKLSLEEFKLLGEDEN